MRSEPTSPITEEQPAPLYMRAPPDTIDPKVWGKALAVDFAAVTDEVDRKQALTPVGCVKDPIVADP